MKSATVLIADASGLILAISRGHDTTDWGMPGGYIERGEKPAEAAARELREETNISIRPEQLVPIYVQDGCVTFTPRAKSIAIPDLLYSEPFEGFVEFVPPEKIACPSCSFGRSNGKMLRALGLIA